MDLEFTEKQREIFRLVLQGYTNQEAAKALGCTSYSIKQRLERIHKKLGIKSVRRDVPKYLDCELFQIGLRELGILE